MPALEQCNDKEKAKIGIQIARVAMFTGMEIEREGRATIQEGSLVGSDYSSIKQFAR